MPRSQHDDPPSPAGHRARKIPRDLGLRFKAICRRDGVIEAYYVYGWLWAAVIMAKQGKGDALPSAIVGRGTVGPTIQVRWTQGEAQYQEFLYWIQDVAGSSMTMVIRSAVAQCVEVDGTLNMTWPEPLGELPPSHS